MNSKTHRMNDESSEGLKMSQVFLIVLFLHVFVIGGAYLFHHLRNNAETSVQTTGNAATAPATTLEKKTVSNDALPTPEVEKPLIDTTPGTTTGVAAPMMEDAGENFSQPQQPAAQANPTLEGQQPSASVRTHKVVSGENISRIAKNYGVTPTAIREANGLKSDVIKVGQILRVPYAGKQAAVPASPAPAAPRNTVHVVGKGETLTKIAQKYGVTPQKLIEANRLKDPSRIHVGTKLMVPGSSSVAAEPTLKPAPVKSGKSSSLAMTGKERP